MADVLIVFTRCIGILCIGLALICLVFVREACLYESPKLAWTIVCGGFGFASVAAFIWLRIGFW